MSNLYIALLFSNDIHLMILFFARDLFPSDVNVMKQFRPSATNEALVGHVTVVIVYTHCLIISIHTNNV